MSRRMLLLLAEVGDDPGLGMWDYEHSHGQTWSALETRNLVTFSDGFSLYQRFVELTERGWDVLYGVDSAMRAAGHPNWKGGEF